MQAADPLDSDGGPTSRHAHKTHEGGAMVDASRRRSLASSPEGPPKALVVFTVLHRCKCTAASCTNLVHSGDRQRGRHTARVCLERSAAVQLLQQQLINMSPTLQTARDVCKGSCHPGSDGEGFCSSLQVVVLERPHKHRDPTNHAFWNPPCLGPWNQNVGALCSCGLWGPKEMWQGCAGQSSACQSSEPQILKKP